MWHIRGGNNLGNHPFITMTTCQFISFSDFSNLRHLNFNSHQSPCVQFISFIPRQNLYPNNSASFTVWNAERCVSYFLGFLSKNSSQQSFFGSQFGLAFGLYLTNQNIIWSNFCTNPNNS